MMRRICEETDRHGRCAYVLAAPEGVRLYGNFGFKIVGCVQTSQGIITSMLRPSDEMLGKINGQTMFLLENVHVGWKKLWKKVPKYLDTLPSLAHLSTALIRMHGFKMRCE
jgi:hypothetical protein